MRYVTPSVEIDTIVAGACLLAIAALVLLWRQYQQRAELDALRRLLSVEREQRALSERALADTRKQVCHLSGSQQSLRDAERRRIARDLHDDLGQHLLALSMDVRALAERHAALGPPLTRLDQHLQHASRAMRSIVRDLQPEALESGLQGAVQQQVEQFSRLSGIPCPKASATYAGAAPLRPRAASPLSMSSRKASTRALKAVGERQKTACPPSRRCCRPRQRFAKAIVSM